MNMEFKKDIAILILVSFMICGTFFQFVSYVTPGWTTFKYTNQYNASWFHFHEKLKEGYTYNWGMWYYRVCNKTDECMTKSYHQEYHDHIAGLDERTAIKWNYGNMYGYMVLEQMRSLASLMCSLASCITMVVFVKCQQFSIFMAFTTVILTVISETLAIQLIVEYGHNERWSSTYPRYIYEHQHYVPYSIILCAVGLVFRLPGSIYCTAHTSKALY